MKLSIVQSFKDSRLTLWNAIDFQVHLKSLSFYEDCDEMVHAYPYALILIHVLWTTKICLEIKLFNVCIQYIRKNGTSQCTLLKWCCQCCFFSPSFEVFCLTRESSLYTFFSFYLAVFELVFIWCRKKTKQKRKWGIPRFKIYAHKKIGKKCILNTFLSNKIKLK